jgi:hypothetical protein
VNDDAVLHAIRDGMGDGDLAEPPALPATPSIPPELAELVARRLRLAAEAKEASRLLARTRHRVEQYQAARASTDVELVYLLAEDMGLAARIDPETGRAPAVVVEGAVVVLNGKAGASLEELSVEVLEVHGFGLVERAG